MNTRDVITFQGRTVKELQKALKDSIEDYLVFCAARGEDPDKPLSGKFVLRISPELHREVTIAAAREGKSLNKWVAERLAFGVSRRKNLRSRFGELPRTGGGTASRSGNLRSAF